jgi:hypothetical protein
VATEGGDCDDADAAISPAATESCDGVDNDCDGTVDVDVIDGGVYYLDADDDGYGDDTTALSACETPNGYVPEGGDCDDGDAATNPGADPEECTDPNDRNCDGSFGFADADDDGVPACMDCDDGDATAFPDAVEVCDGVDNDCDGETDTDALDLVASWPDGDGDGYGETDAGTVGCDVPAGWVTEEGDCDDADAAFHPGADESDCTDPTDYNCDGSVAYADADGDGWAACTECDDADAAVNPDAVEICDGVDDDCDGTIDGALAVGATTFHDDVDGDGYGDATRSAVACDAPVGYVADATDCDDTRARTNPGASEYCDSIDDDCDGDVDESDAVDVITWYADADADYYGDPATSVVACDRPLGYTHDDTDCDDAHANAFPGASESCDTLDNDCDGTVDEADSPDATTWYADADADTYGDAAHARIQCYAPSGYVADATDCNDARAATNPGASEYCNSIDDNCSGAVDEGAAVDATTWYVDADADNYGSTDTTETVCTRPSGYAALSTDCDDGNSAIHPGASERCDLVDNNCDGSTDEATAIDASTWYRDADGDGYGVSTTHVVQCYIPTGYVADATDCLDTSSVAHPGGTEVCNSVDDDCDGTVDDNPSDGDLYYADADFDGFGDPTDSIRDCDAAPYGYRADDSDCDDSSATVHPYRYEETGDGIDNDCDGYTDSADPDVVNTGPSSDDSSTTVTLSTMAYFPFCGTRYSTMYMISNGRVTFGSADLDSSETASDFASDIAVAGAWDDLNPSAGVGRTYYIEYSDAIGFYWRNVRETGTSTTNSFSIVLFDDGRIMLEYGALAMTDGMAGFSCGRTAGSSSDLTAQMDALDAAWGIGTGTDNYLYEVFTTSSTNDLDNTIVRLCGNPNSSRDACDGL